MPRSSRRLSGPTRMGLLSAVAVAVVGLSVAAPANANTDNFGRAVYDCAGVMLPYAISSRGSITMTMPDGSVMYWRTFGDMVRSMRTHDMC